MLSYLKFISINNSPVSSRSRFVFQYGRHKPRSDSVGSKVSSVGNTSALDRGFDSRPVQIFLTTNSFSEQLNFSFTLFPLSSLMCNIHLILDVMILAVKSTL